MDVVIYARLSLDKLGNELGVDRQLEACRELAARQGWTVTRELIDNSISATTGRVRPAFEKLLTLSPKPEAIIVWHLDRLVRLTRELDRVISYGVPVHAVTAGMLDLSNPTGVLMANVVTAFSQFEGQQKAARQRLAATQRASQGRPWWSARPFGYERDGSPRSGEAEAVQRAYQDLLAGRSLLSIADEWNRQGMPTTRGRNWTGATVRQLLMSARNCAIRTYAGDEVGPGNWDALVPEEIYRSAVRVLNSPTRKTGGGGPRRSLLTGVATCANCGGPIRTAWRGRKGEQGSYAVYECKFKHCVSHRQDEADTMVSERVIRFLTAPQFAEAFEQSEDDLPAQQMRDELGSLRSRLDDLATDYAAGLVTRSQFLTASQTMRSRVDELEDQLSQLGSDSAVKGVTGMTDEQVRRHWDGLDVDRRRSLILAVVVSCRLRQKGRGVRRTDERHVDVLFRAGDPAKVASI
ncbi:recombinase family protein [Micromonospora chalcea]|uniref:recombinase family protein n=1 Tax=Micromonospora sp. TSRI0369 TaxID=1703936 RepID=UPI00093BAF34|nr:recombinase family protein [Micromonospora sp. TSRI0369]OKJ42148.1 hypothetical protein AMK25_22810 [Micromonospora sp. TSRI0369]